MDPHHTKYRLGKNLFTFVFVHRECHNLIHGRQIKKAIRLKLLPKWAIDI